MLVNADAEFRVCKLINAVYDTDFRAVQFSVECLIRLEVCSGIFFKPFLQTKKKNNLFTQTYHCLSGNSCIKKTHLEPNISHYNFPKQNMISLK